MSVLTRKGSPEKRFIFLVSLPPGSAADGPGELARKVAAALEQRELARHPVTWHLPAADLTAETARMIHDRIERFGDSVVPMGLTGAPHPLLHVAEIASDVEWSITNLWHTGVTDTLHSDAAIIIPRSPDFLRAEALEAYGSAKVPVGMLGSAEDGLWISVAPPSDESGPDGATSRALPVLDAATIDAPARRALQRALARRRRSARSLGGVARPVVIRSCVTSEDDIERLSAILAAVAETTGRPGWRVAPLNLEAAAGPTPDLIASDTPHLAPAVAAATTDLRRSRSSKINTRRILEHFAAGPGGVPPQTSPRSPKRGKREFIASMMGQTSIPGSTMSAHFVGGALCGVHGSDIETGALRPASSYIITGDGRRVDQSMSSCFSFESEISRGLRSECSIVDPDTGASARIRTEYSFVGDYDALVTTQHTLLEGGNRNDTLMVLGVPILDREHCAITGRYRDGSTYDVDVSWKLPEIVLAAEVFGIWDGESNYTLVPLTAACHPMPWTMILLGRPEPQIVVGGRYPFGSSAEHHLSFLMIRGDIDDELAERALAGRLPAAIAEEIAAGTAAELSIRREPLAASR